MMFNFTENRKTFVTQITRNQDTGQYQPYLWNADGGIKDSFEDIGISSGIKDVRQETGYNKAEFEQQFNKWKNEQNNK